MTHIRKVTNGAARGAEVVDTEGGTHEKITGLEHEYSLKTQRGTSTDRWNKAQKTQPVSTGKNKWGRRKHMSPSSEETPGHTGQELKVSLEVLSLTLLCFVCCTSAAAPLRNLYMFTPYLSQEHRVMLDLKLLESF